MSSTADVRAPSAADLAARLRAGELDDHDFDALYPQHVRSVSATFWTPLSVAQRAGVVLDALGARAVLDVGAGVGKFCIAAAAVAPSVRFYGIEQRAALVAVARDVAARLELPNVELVVGDATRAAVTDFDALYFFNPFAENLFSDSLRFDRAVEHSALRWREDVARVEQALSAARVGTAVLTYHTFGGSIPECFSLLHNERAGTDWLRIWRKDRAPKRGDRSWNEDDACEAVVAPELLSPRRPPSTK